MEFLNNDNLVAKSGNGSSDGPNNFIRQAIKAIPEGKSLRMIDLADEVMKNFSTSGKSEKDRRQRVYIRIGMQYNKLVGRGAQLGKAVDINGYTRIVNVKAPKAEVTESVYLTEEQIG